MKKTLILVLTLAVSMAMFAQEKVLDKSRLSKANFTNMKKATNITLNTVSNEAKTNGSARSKANGVYYLKPEGGLYATEYEGINSTINTFYIVPAWEEEYTYKNMSTNPANTYWMAYDSNTYKFSDYMQGDTDLTIAYLYPTYGYWTPILRDNSGLIKYTMDYYYFDEEYGGHEGMMYASYTVEPMSFYNNKSWYIWGAMDNENVVGSGTVTYENVKYTVESVGQLFPAPASPLYAESIDVMGNVILSTGNEVPFSNGAELTMKIYNTDTQELMETLTASAESGFKGTQMTRNGSAISVGLVNFTKKYNDPIFGEMTEPITIDYPSTIIIEGFDNSDVNLGLAIVDKLECDDTTFLPEDEPGDVFFGGVSGSDERELRYEGSALLLNFNGIMDKICAADEIMFGDDHVETGYSILKISDDGKSCDTYGKENEGNYNLGAIYLETVREWYDEDSNENYYYTVYETTDEENDWWITGLNIYDYYEDYGYYLVDFEAEPLPSGMTGRSAILYFTGAGYTDSQPVILLQGDAEVPDGINSVLAYPEKADGSSKFAGTYNLAGQRVPDGTKGLVVKDGKKVLVK